MPVLGIDVGGTDTKFGLVTKQGKIQKKGSVATESAKGEEAVLQNIERIIGELLNSQVTAIAIGLPGAVDVKKQLFLGGPNIPLENVYLSRRLKRKFKLPVLIENDANAAAVGEAWVGAGRGCKNIVMLTLGTGLGGGIIIDGKMLTSPIPGVGEVGHMIVSGNDVVCSAGHHGCLEGVASSRVILREAQREISDDIKTVKEVSLLARNGNKKAIGLFDHAGEQFARALATLMHVFAPEKIVIGGGLAAAWDLLIEPAMNYLPYYVWEGRMTQTSIVPSQLGNYAGVIGVAKLAMDQQK